MYKRNYRVNFHGVHRRVWQLYGHILHTKCSSLDLDLRLNIRLLRLRLLLLEDNINMALYVNWIDLAQDRVNLVIL
jgi:hypothetical protein